MIAWTDITPEDRAIAYRSAGALWMMADSISEGERMIDVARYLRKGGATWGDWVYWVVRREEYCASLTESRTIDTIVQAAP